MNKYRTPRLEEFVDGFEYEYERDGNWFCETIKQSQIYVADNIKTLKRDIKLNKVRVMWDEIALNVPHLSNAIESFDSFVKSVVRPNQMTSEVLSEDVIAKCLLVRKTLKDISSYMDRIDD